MVRVTSLRSQTTVQRLPFSWRIHFFAHRRYKFSRKPPPLLLLLLLRFCVVAGFVQVPSFDRTQRSSPLLAYFPASISSCVLRDCVSKSQDMAFVCSLTSFSRRIVQFHPRPFPFTFPSEIDPCPFSLVLSYLLVLTPHSFCTNPLLFARIAPFIFFALSNRSRKELPARRDPIRIYFPSHPTIPVRTVLHTTFHPERGLFRTVSSFIGDET